jgi:hypothetical protein
MVFWSVVKPVLFRSESDENSRGPSMPCDDESSDSASRRYRDKSSFTFARATRRGCDTLLVEPRLARGLRDDGEDLDFLFGDVIENPDLPYPQQIRVVRRPASCLLRLRIETHRDGHQSWSGYVSDPQRLIPPLLDGRKHCFGQKAVARSGYMAVARDPVRVDTALGNNLNDPPAPKGRVRVDGSDLLLRLGRLHLRHVEAGLCCLVRIQRVADQDPPKIDRCGGLRIASTSRGPHR